MSEILRNGYGAGKIMLNGVAYGKIVGSSGADISEIDDFYGIKHYGPIPVSTNIDEENLTMKVLTIDHYDSAADQYAEIKTKMATAGFNSDTVDYTNGIDLYLDNGDTGKHLIINILYDTTNNKYIFTIKFKNTANNTYLSFLNSSGDFKFLNNTRNDGSLDATNGFKMVYNQLGSKADGIFFKFLIPSEANTTDVGIAYICPESANDDYIILGSQGFGMFSSVLNNTLASSRNKIYGLINQMATMEYTTPSTDSIQITRFLGPDEHYCENFFVANVYPDDIASIDKKNIRRFYIDNEPYGVMAMTSGFSTSSRTGMKPVVKLPK